MSKVPMGQMCLYANCVKDATKEIDGMYFCNEHPLKNKIKIEGFIARDRTTNKVIQYDTHFYSSKPERCKVKEDDYYLGKVFHIPEILNLKHGECKEVEITIVVLH
jgi:hypothetical protein